MKTNILVLGAGLVSRPGVRYLLDQQDLNITVASRTVAKAEALVEGYANGRALQLDVENETALANLIAQYDIVISLLPWIHHVKVANLCLEYGRDMATTSYVSEGMQALDKAVRERGLLFLNELGVDPGIDHMSAMQIIDQVHAANGRVVDFYSVTGGLPAPEDNDNPFGYKFSWSPRGVILASRNSARYLEHGRIVEVEGRNLFLERRLDPVEGIGELVIYPNRDSLPYRDIYGIPEAETVMRGTYRYPGWCETMKAMVDLGLIDDTPRKELQKATMRQMMALLSGVTIQDDVRAAAARKLGVSRDAAVLDNMEWLGLFSDDPVGEIPNPLDILSQRMQEKMGYAPGERDMIVMRHTFVVENADQTRERITSTLIDFGEPHGDTSMARTVSLPLAVGVSLMAREKINQVGVVRPVSPAVYEPVMAELSRLGIAMREKREKI
ncbi:MAG: saccharopine dehydrogenase C-terminal domain-containing protein [Acidobacteriota bacterium]|jgi:saccharopine dehydrogenase-like NADP-dependent oxidoreductase|nr:saccharopine dehydrogenase C-terminal domain-containing protein [Acidobacteriota bacterium]